MKLVSPCDRAKNVSQETFKSPMRLFYDRALLYSCNLSLSANQILDYFSSMGGKPTFIFSEHMVTIFTYHIQTRIYYNTCVKCERNFNKYYYEFDRIVWVREGMLFIVPFCERYREKEYRKTVITCLCWSKLSTSNAMLIWQRQCRLLRLCYVYTRGMKYYYTPVCKQSRA